MALHGSLCVRACARARPCCCHCVPVLIESEGGGWRQGEDNEVGEGQHKK